MSVQALLAVLQGKAIVLVKRGENKADVMIGKGISKQFAISSMAGAIKSILL